MRPRAAQAAGTYVPRDRVIWTAEDYRSYEWYTSGTGAKVGVPYWWGGFQTIAQFQAALADDSAIGDGVDCSGFVSRALELSYHCTTLCLRGAAVSDPIAPGQELRGDMYILADPHDPPDMSKEHVVLWYTVVAGVPWFYEATTRPPDPTNLVRLNKTGGYFYLSGYSPYRYKNITSDLHTYLPTSG